MIHEQESFKNRIQKTTHRSTTSREVFEASHNFYPLGLHHAHDGDDDYGDIVISIKIKFHHIAKQRPHPRSNSSSRQSLFRHLIVRPIFYISEVMLLDVQDNILLQHLQFHQLHNFPFSLISQFHFFHNICLIRGICNQTLMTMNLFHGFAQFCRRVLEHVLLHHLFHCNYDDDSDFCDCHDKDDSDNDYVYSVSPFE